MREINSLCIRVCVCVYLLSQTLCVWDLVFNWIHSVVMWCLYLFVFPTNVHKRVFSADILCVGRKWVCVFVFVWEGDSVCSRGLEELVCEVMWSGCWWGSKVGTVAVERQSTPSYCIQERAACVWRYMQTSCCPETFKIRCPCYLSLSLSLFLSPASILPLFLAVHGVDDYCITVKQCSDGFEFAWMSAVYRLKMHLIIKQYCTSGVQIQYESSES